MENIHPLNYVLDRQEKEKFLKQKGLVIWLTGMSGAGKSTLGNLLERSFQNNGLVVKLLDGDNIRNGINKNLGFSNEDRLENIRRVSEIAKLFVDAGIITICSFISPTDEIRDLAKNIIGEKDFTLIYILNVLWKHVK